MIKEIVGGQIGPNDGHRRILDGDDILHGIKGLFPFLFGDLQLNITLVQALCSFCDQLFQLFFVLLQVFLGSSADFNFIMKFGVGGLQ